MAAAAVWWRWFPTTEQPDVHHVHHRSLDRSRVRLRKGWRQYLQLHQQGGEISLIRYCCCMLPNTEACRRLIIYPLLPTRRGAARYHLDSTCQWSCHAFSRERCRQHHTAPVMRKPPGSEEQRLIIAAYVRADNMLDTDATPSATEQRKLWSISLLLPIQTHLGRTLNLHVSLAHLFEHRFF